MKNQSALNWLVPFIAVLTLIVVGAGLFWRSEGSPYTFSTLYGEMVQIYGQGLYEHDTIFSAGASQDADLVALFVALPLLLISFALYRRDSLIGGFLLTIELAYYLYYSASLGLVVACNKLYLVYLMLFSLGFLAFILSLMMFDLSALPAQISQRLTRHGMAIFIFLAGLGTAFIWLSDVANALTTDGVPETLGASISLITYTLDVGIIAPVCLLAGVQLLRRAPLGYLLTGVLLLMLVLVGAMVIGRTVMQVKIGVELSPNQMVEMVVTWVIMGGIAVWLSTAFLRNISNPTIYEG